MTADDLKDARCEVGRAVFGRALSYRDMAHLCGLAPASGADTVRKWELGKIEPTGPVLQNIQWMLNVLDIHASLEVRDAFAATIRKRLFEKNGH